MAHDVFISWSHRDKNMADAACHALEAAGIRCWIAPRDVRPGETWANAIVRAIDESRVLLVVFSSEANNSPQVMREVERAVRREQIIIPLRIENVAPSGNMDYFLSATHWLDAFGPDPEVHFRELVRAINTFVGREEGSVAAKAAPEPTAPSTTTPPVAPSQPPTPSTTAPPVLPSAQVGTPAETPATTPVRAVASRRLGPLIGSIAAVVVLAGIVALWLTRQRPSPGQPLLAEPAAQATPESPAEIAKAEPPVAAAPEPPPVAPRAEPAAPEPAPPSQPEPAPEAQKAARAQPPSPPRLLRSRPSGKRVTLAAGQSKSFSIDAEIPGEADRHAGLSYEWRLDDAVKNRGGSRFELQGDAVGEHRLAAIVRAPSGEEVSREWRVTITAPPAPAPPAEPARAPEAAPAAPAPPQEAALTRVPTGGEAESSALAIVDLVDTPTADKRHLVVKGRLRNQGDVALSRIAVVVRALDGAGNVVTEKEGIPTPQTLAPGKVATFSLQMANDDAIRSFEVKAVAQH